MTIRSSHSSRATHDSCKLKWWLQRVKKVEEPAKPALVIGTGVHELADLYATARPLVLPDDFERWPGVSDADLYSVLYPGLKHLPFSPGATPEERDGWMVEEWIRADIGGVPFTGKVDLHKPTTDGVLRVEDWKTSKSYDFKYAKSARSLARDPQMLTYAYRIGVDNPPETIEMAHIYVTTSALYDGCPDVFDSKRVEALPVPWQMAVDAWDDMVRATESMAQIAESVPADTSIADAAKAVEHNPKACYKYGGCPFSAVCPMSPKNRDAEIEEFSFLIPRSGNKPKPQPENTTHMSTQSDKLAALYANIGLSQPSEPKPLVPEPSQPETPAVPEPQATADSMASLISSIQTLAATGNVPFSAAREMCEAQGFDPTVVLPQADVRNNGGKLTLKSAPAEPPAPERSNPPIEELLLGLSEDEAKPHIKRETGARRLTARVRDQFLSEHGLTVENGVIVAASEASTHENTAGEAESAPIETPKNTAPVVAPVGSLDPPSSQLPLGNEVQGSLFPGQTFRNPAAPEAARTSEYTFYVDCGDSDCSPIDDVLMSVIEAVEKDAGVPHYGLIPYNQGPKRVAALLKARLEENIGALLIPGQGVFIPSRHPLAPEVISVFRTALPAARWIQPRSF